MNARSRRRLSILGLVGTLLVTAGVSASAQSIGSGASPGRAAYRPRSDWNNGPFYTVNHVDPYGPRPAVDTGLIESDPSLPPFGNVPHGRYAAVTPGRGALTPYGQGFSAYSGYADWYGRTYGVAATRERVVQARTLFFRSAPAPPPGVLSPLPPTAGSHSRSSRCHSAA